MSGMKSSMSHRNKNILYRIPMFTILICLIVGGGFALLGTGIIGIKLLFQNPNRKEKV